MAYYRLKARDYNTWIVQAPSLRSAKETYCAFYAGMECGRSIKTIDYKNPDSCFTWEKAEKITTEQAYQPSPETPPAQLACAPGKQAHAGAGLGFTVQHT